MQKKIIALAVAAALTAPAMAFAEATVYGQANLSVDMVNDGAASNSSSTNNLVSNVSRLGFKGSEDLGNGMSAVFQMESEVGMDAGTTTTGQFFNRDTFLGLSSADMGTLVLGRHDTPYKMATRKLDVFADTAADNRNMMGFGVMDARLDNVIAYVSPNLSGLTIAAATTFGAETAANGDTKGSALSLAGMYSMDAIYATFAYQTIKAGTAGSGDMGADSITTLANKGVLGMYSPTIAVDDKITSFKLGGGYSMDQITVNAVYESNKIAFSSGGDVKQTDIYLAGKFALSDTDAVKLAYTMKGATKTTGGDLKDKATQIAIGYDHAMSKNTTVYAMYAKQTWEDTLADPSTLSVGIKHSF